MYLQVGMLLFKIPKQTGTCVDKMCGNKLTKNKIHPASLYDLYVC